MNLYWIGTSCRIITSLSAFPSTATNAFSCPLERPDSWVLSLELSSLSDPQPTLNLIVPNREGEEKTAVGWLNSSQDGTLLCLGGAGEQITEGGFLALSEREGLIVCCCWNRSQRPVQFFGQGWAKLPCHKIIAERISVEFRVVSKGALCYSSLQAEGRTSALGQALLLTSSHINEHAFCIFCLFILLVPLNLLLLSL